MVIGNSPPPHTQNRYCTASKSVKVIIRPASLEVTSLVELYRAMAMARVDDDVDDDVDADVDDDDIHSS